MKKAAKKATSQETEKASAPVNLGTKRTCTKCSTRFYDFGKTEITCPKCHTELDPQELDPTAKFQALKKAVRAADVEETPEPSAVATDIEEVDDLGDSDEVVEDIVGADDDDDEF